MKVSRNNQTSELQRVISPGWTTFKKYIRVIYLLGLK